MCTPPMQTQAVWVTDVLILTGESLDTSLQTLLQDMWCCGSACTHPAPCDPVRSHPCPWRRSSRARY